MHLQAHTEKQDHETQPPTNSCSDSFHKPPFWGAAKNSLVATFQNLKDIAGGQWSAPAGGPSYSSQGHWLSRCINKFVIFL
jgi:hypothetical protein